MRGAQAAKTQNFSRPRQNAWIWEKSGTDKQNEDDVPSERAKNHPCPVWKPDLILSWPKKSPDPKVTPEYIRPKPWTAKLLPTMFCFGVNFAAQNSIWQPRNIDNEGERGPWDTPQFGDRRRGEEPPTAPSRDYHTKTKQDCGPQTANPDLAGFLTPRRTRRLTNKNMTPHYTDESHKRK